MKFDVWGEFIRRRRRFKKRGVCIEVCGRRIFRNLWRLRGGRLARLEGEKSEWVGEVGRWRLRSIRWVRRVFGFLF